MWTETDVRQYNIKLYCQFFFYINLLFRRQEDHTIIYSITI